MRFQNQPEREALFALYTFAHTVDDIADGPGPVTDKLTALETWRSWFSDGGTVQGYECLSSGLADVIERFDLPEDPFLALIAGMEADVNGPIVAPSWTALEKYCGQVAGAVGELCLAIWGWRGDDAKAFATATGDALQLTNILRDVSEDAQIGRLYIPEDALKIAGVGTRDPIAVLTDPNLSRAFAAVIDRAETRFTEARALWPQQAEKTLRPAWIMLRSYEALFHKINAAEFSPNGNRIRLSKIEKLFHFSAAYLSCP